MSRRMTVTLPLGKEAEAETDAALQALGELLKPGNATPAAQMKVKALARKAQRKAAECR